MSLIYNIREGDRVPISMESWNDLVSAVRDGKSLYAHGCEQKPVSLSRIYAFKLEGKDTLKNITDETRERLESQLTK